MADTHPRTAILGSSHGELRSGRTSAKWERLTDDVILMWVAEMDSVLAFGGSGAGWIRMNIGTSPEIIATALRRMAALR